MERRTFLTAAAGALSSAALAAGCLGETNPVPGRRSATDDGPPGNATGTRTPTPTPTRTVEPAEQTMVEFGSAPEEPFRTERVGDGVDREDRKPHELVVWNDGPERRLLVRIDPADDTPGFDGTLAFPANGYLLASVTERVDHEVFVGPAEAGALSKLTLDAGFVDCNDSRTTVRVPESGRAEYSTISTAVACRVGTTETPGTTDGG